MRQRSFQGSSSPELGAVIDRLGAAGDGDTKWETDEIDDFDAVAIAAAQSSISPCKSLLGRPSRGDRRSQ